MFASLVEPTTPVAPDHSVFTTTQSLVDILQVMVGGRITLDQIDKINRGDWVLVRGEVVSFTETAAGLTDVRLKTDSDDVLLVAGTHEAPILPSIDEEHQFRILPVQNLAAYQPQFLSAAKAQLVLSCICDRRASRLEILSVASPPPPVIPPAVPRSRIPVEADDMDDLPPPLKIDLRFIGTFSPVQREKLQLAAERWSQVLRDGWPPIEMSGQVVDRVMIIAVGRFLDRSGGVLGIAQPTHVRPDSGLPVRSVMEFDRDDLARLEAEDALSNVFLHEMGHALGYGALWSDFELLRGVGTDDPVYIGAEGQREYARLIDSDVPQPVPIENMGGPATLDGHWRELIFGNELMTGYLSGGLQPLSRLTVASFADLGYVVDYDAADAYALPTELELDMMGLLTGMPHLYRCNKCRRNLRGPQSSN